MNVATSLSFYILEKVVFGHNPTPHASIPSILQTMKFASFTRIGLCTFGSCCVLVYNLSKFVVVFFLA
jgi:hypothetical protein